MKKSLFLLLIATSGSLLFGTNWSEMPARYQELRDKHVWKIPSDEEGVDALTRGIIGVWGENRKGRTPAAIRSQVESYSSDRWLGHSRLSLNEKKAILKSLMTACEERFASQSKKPE